MNDVNKNLRAFHLSIDELLKALAHSEDVNLQLTFTLAQFLDNNTGELIRYIDVSLFH